MAVPIGLSPPLILTLCGPERVLVVSTEPPDDLSGLTTSRRRAVARAVDQEGRGGGVTSLPLPMHPCPGVTYQRQSFS